MRVCSKEKSAPKPCKKTQPNHRSTAQGPGELGGELGGERCARSTAAALPSRPSWSHLEGARSFTQPQGLSEEHRARQEAPLRAALRRVRLRAKRSAEPAEPARPGPGVTPALGQCLWQGGGLWAGPPPLTEPQHRDAVAAGEQHRWDTARTGPARSCHDPAEARDYNSQRPLRPDGTAGSRETRNRELGNRETGIWEPGNEQLVARLSPGLRPGPGVRRPGWPRFRFLPEAVAARARFPSMLYLVGLGLGDAKDITVKGLEAVRRCRRVYLEAYTSVLTVGKEALVGLATGPEASRATGQRRAGAGGSVGEISGARSREKYVRDLHILCFIGESGLLPGKKTAAEIKCSSYNCWH